ncbi:MAG: hypothetical protein IPM40_03990 [Gammaproteobacteria bacterium]|nr:hypothetical protein [Gammaproteobacteria bacterium]
MRDNATHASAGERQRRPLLAALRLGPVTTLDARERLNVIHLAAGVLELRERGHRILTTWTHEPDAWGRPHRIARYALARLERGVEA